MSEPTGHCPYLGLKQNRAIRFSTPTLEHRCYVGGDPIDIPVDQSSFCLSSKHIQCPLYMGLSAPTTTSIRPTPPVVYAQPSGLRGWFATLSPRDRTIYAIMIGILALIMLIYLTVGIQSLLGTNPLPSADVPTTAPASPTSTSVVPTPTQVPATPTIPPPPTVLPTGTTEPLPTPRPTQAPIILVPTLAVTETPSTSAPTSVTATSVAATATVPAGTTATAAPASATPRPATAAPASATPRPVTAAPVATSAPVATVPPAPTSVPAPTAAPAPTATTPPIATRRERLWLYFGDATGTLFVPVQRTTDVVDQQTATAAIRELIAGPRDGLERLINADARLLGVRVGDGTATVNFDRDPSNGDYERALYSVVLSLTHFSTVERVQFQINGANIGIGGSGPIRRPVVNPLNPQGLPVDFATTEFLPLYFLANDGQHSIRIIRMVPKTQQTASGTIQALIEGPGEYSYAVYRTIPEGTALLGVTLEGGIATVNFSAPFAEASNRNATIRSVVESLTTLSSVRGVQVQVEGQSLGNLWGAPYGDVYRQPTINPE